jgi:hypothetical protein
MECTIMNKIALTYGFPNENKCNAVRTCWDLYVNDLDSLICKAEVNDSSKSFHCHAFTLGRNFFDLQ